MNDPTIIQFVKGVFLEFTHNCEPTKISARPSMFNSKEKLIVHEEINKLLQKGVIKKSHNEHGEFISPIFLRPKPRGGVVHGSWELKRKFHSSQELKHTFHESCIQRLILFVTHIVLQN